MVCDCILNLRIKPVARRLLVASNAIYLYTPRVQPCCPLGRVMAPANTLQQMAHNLAASKQGKSAQVVWSRALLHQLAAQAQIQEGETYHTGSHVTGIHEIV